MLLHDGAILGHKLSRWLCCNPGIVATDDLQGISFVSRRPAYHTDCKLKLLTAPTYELLTLRFDR